MKKAHKDLVTKFCREAYLEKGSKVTSKTIEEGKAKKIKEVIKGEKSEVHSSSFKFWVKKKKFELLSYPELNLNEVLCVPAKVTVR